MTKFLLIFIVLIGSMLAKAEAQLSPTKPVLHVEYWFNIGTIHSGTVAKVLVLFRNDSSDTAKFNGSDYYPEVEISTLDGQRVKTKDEVEGERTDSRIVTTKDYIPDNVVVSPKSSITRQYDFAPWQSYNLKPGLYIAKVNGSSSEFYFSFSK